MIVRKNNGEIIILTPIKMTYVHGGIRIQDLFLLLKLIEYHSNTFTSDALKIVTRGHNVGSDLDTSFKYPYLTSKFPA